MRKIKTIKEAGVYYENNFKNKVKQYLFKLNWPTIIVTGFFLIYFLIGLMIYKDYGISCDEPVERRHGIVTYAYLSQKLETYFLGSYTPPTVDLNNRQIVDLVEVTGIPKLSEYRDKVYGSIYGLLLYLVEKIIGIGPESAQIFYMRHLVNFWIFFLATIFFYKIAKNHWDDWKIGLLASAMLILSPRMFGEAFYNNKDIAFLSVFIISIYFLINFLQKKTIRSAIVFAFFSALAINVRIMGVILPAVGMLLYFMELFKARIKKVKEVFFVISSYILFLIIFVIILWPYLWSSPLYNFLNAFRTMSHYDPNMEHLGLYFGNIISSQHLPWHYIPVWLFITTPVLYSFLFLVGLVYVAKNLLKMIKSHAFFTSLQFELLAVFLFFIPLLTVIISHSWLYDGWRQMYFIYPPLILLGISGFVSIRNWTFKKSNNQLIKNIPSILILIYLAVVLFQIIRIHPFQNVYFNKFAGKVENRFDRDYWGQSYAAALKYIVKYDNRENVIISTDSSIGMINILTIDTKDRNKIIFTTPDKADYIITEFRPGHNCHYQNELKSFYSGQTKIITIYSGGQNCRLY